MADTGDPEKPLDPLQLVGRLWHDLGELRAALKGKQGSEWLKPPSGLELGIRTRENETGLGVIMEVAEVDLADEIQPFLAKAFEASFDPEWDDPDESQCKVWIDTRRAPPSGAPLPVILGLELIGTLVAEDALVLEEDLRQAQKREQPMILEATIERERGQFSVWVNVPPGT